MSAQAAISITKSPKAPFLEVTNLLGHSKSERLHFQPTYSTSLAKAGNLAYEAWQTIAVISLRRVIAGTFHFASHLAAWMHKRSGLRKVVVKRSFDGLQRGSTYTLMSTLSFSFLSTLTFNRPPENLHEKHMAHRWGKMNEWNLFVYLMYTFYDSPYLSPKESVWIQSKTPGRVRLS